MCLGRHVALQKVVLLFLASFAPRVRLDLRSFTTTADPPLALPHLYPNLGAIEARPAWQKKDPEPGAYDRLIQVSLQVAEDAARSRRRARSWR